MSVSQPREAPAPAAGATPTTPAHGGRGPDGGHGPRVVIEPRRGWSLGLLREVWASRELLYFLVWRDVKIRYTQAALGATWAIIQPLLMMIVFAVLLGRFAKLPSDGLPYPVFALAGLVPWVFFANGVNSATESLVNNSYLIGKVYFPRILIPIASLLSWLLDVVVASVMLAGVMLLYGVEPGWTVVFLPAFVAFALVAAASVSVWLSALNVAYRDVRHAIPFVLQLWLFVTPVVYPVTLVPERYRTLMGLNPMSGVVTGFRWSLFGTQHPEWPMIALSAGITLAVLVAGLVYFRRVEHSFADVI